jgi:AraC-like DNA-binding protein
MSDSVSECRLLSGHARSSPVTYRGTPLPNGAIALKCLALVSSYDDRTRLRGALAGTAEPHFVGSVAEVLQVLRADHGSIRVVLLEAHDAAGRPAAGLARQVTTLFPAMPVVGYCSLRPEDSQDIIALSSAGVHELAFKQHDDHAVLLRTILLSAEKACVADLVLHELEGRLPVRIRPVVEYCLTNPEQAHSVDDVARALGVNRKTLANHCRAEGFPAPGAVVAWSLILLMAGLLASPGVTVERVAGQLNFSSATALRNLLKRYTGLRPAELRTPDAVATLCTRFTGGGLSHSA